ncbi:LysM peptidoglycan-binding domain-containing protein [Bacilliculturomica massiliensis]|uniref:LysM peptidoglycan-binding domain-containing protein n=1 Tax=Bacilliculturomica massiliensis TaxID=1917867 RepID=UPI001030D546|nr:LysM peptidoglycan-binding domain-containing protein [Bacilliculturomica massiliensis]
MYEFLFDSLQFPVAPESLGIKTKNQNKTINLISGQEINIPEVPGLSDISFTVLLPVTRYPFAVYPDGFHDPAYYLRALKMLKVGKTPFRFIVNRRFEGGQRSFDNDIMVLLEDYTINEDSGNGFDVEVDIKLRQYVSYGAKIVGVIENTTSGEPAVSVTKERPAKQPEKTYTVKSGDNLWMICKTELGDGSKYKEIAKLNNIANANLIHPGQVIRFA